MAAQGGALRVLMDADTPLRALLRRAELDDPRSAFFIRPNERDTGLSVNFDFTPEECRAQFNTTYGVSSLFGGIGEGAKSGSRPGQCSPRKCQRYTALRR